MPSGSRGGEILQEAFRTLKYQTLYKCKQYQVSSGFVLTSNQMDPNVCFSLLQAPYSTIQYMKTMNNKS